MRITRAEFGYVPTGMVFAVAFSSDGTLLTTAGRDASVRLLPVLV
ncbi:hypothetical protein ACWD1Z_36145 [Streptomyces sp. NPDC002784]